ncbi:MAG: tRNA (guanosine(46)-N7)-methyltransferase TrmB, partial [Pseudomonadota bacterium]
LYGRRKGRPIRAARAALLAEWLPTLRPQPGPIADPLTLFRRPVAHVDLEIGFGGGEHSVGLLRQDQDLGLIGCEVFENGVGRFVAHLHEQNALDRACVHDGDARALLDRLPDGGLRRVYVLFPDPWPKTRHAARRFLQSETLDALARVIADKGELRLASDDPTMQRWMLRLGPPHPAFSWTARRPADWMTPPADEPDTRYAAKARAEGRAPIYIRLQRRPRMACADSGVV